MGRTLKIALLISTIFVLLFALCGCESKASSDSDLSSKGATATINSDQSKNANTSTSSGSNSTAKSNATEAAKPITTYEELVNATFGTKVTVEGVSTESAFYRAWGGTHYKFTMTFGDSRDDEIYIDMSTDKKSQDIVRGTRVSVTGVFWGLKGASCGREVPEIELDSYEVLS